MFARKIISARMLLATLLIGCCIQESRAARDANNVLVVPNRYTVVQLGFDIMALRDVTLIACDEDPDIDAPILHVWNRRLDAWERVDANEYAIGAFVEGSIDTMILIGDDDVLPQDVIVGAAQADTIKRIKTLHIATIVNTLDKRMAFAPGEWKWLAKRHNLTIKDRNYARRRWGRYGPPKGKQRDVEPEPIIESSAETEVPPATPESVEAEMNAAFGLDGELQPLEDPEEGDASISDMTSPAPEGDTVEDAQAAPVEAAPAAETPPPTAPAPAMEEKGVPAEMLAPAAEPDSEAVADPEADPAPVPAAGAAAEPAPEDK